MAIEDDEIFCKIVTIDTSHYTGNFERQLCAYVTGQVGQSIVGEEMVPLAQKEMKHLSWWEDNICPQEGSQGSEVYTPCTIWPSEDINHIGEKVEPSNNRSPGYYSVAIFVEEFPPQEVLEEMMQRAKYFCENTKTLYSAEHHINSQATLGKAKNIEVTGVRFITPEMETVLVEKVIVKNNTTTKKIKM